MRREYRERAEAIGAVLGYIKRHKEEKEICEMYETMPLAIVAASMHRSSKTVRAVLAKHGVTMRKYGPRTKKNH